MWSISSAVSSKRSTHFRSRHNHVRLSTFHFSTFPTFPLSLFHFSTFRMLPSTERILLGPGPSLIAPRVMRALAAPVLSHLDPDFVPMLDEVSASLRRVFRADPKALTLATSGTG